MKTILIIIGVVLLIAAVFYFFFWRDKQVEEEAQSTLPPSVQRLVPSSWKVIQQQACDFDSDEQDEWLVVYQYDSAIVEPPNQPDGTQVTISPIGAVIYDAELESPPQAGSGQYQTTTITPYKLLPDYAIGKGQGYLGESAVQMLLFPPVDKDGKCQPRKSAFWVTATATPMVPQGCRRGCPSSTGPARIWATKARFSSAMRASMPTIPKEPNQFITQATTANLLNDRSLLCQSTGYTRAGPKQNSTSSPEAPRWISATALLGSQPTLKAPSLRCSETTSRAKRTDKTKHAAWQELPAPGCTLPAGLAPPVSILAITNTASAAPVPGGGHLCTPRVRRRLEKAGGAVNLRAVVTSEVPVNGVVREVVWT